MNKYQTSAFLTLLSLALTAGAVEQTISTQNRTALNVTIYNGNRALIEDVRDTDLKKGRQSVAFSNVSDEMIAPTALLTGREVKTLEQNFNYDILSYQSLLEKSIGQTVKILLTNPATGEETIQEAELLSFNGTQPLLKRNGTIEALPENARILFNGIPDNLRAKPTLVLDLLSTSEGKKELSLKYLTSGLSWNADYVAQLTPDSSKITLNGYVTLNNTTGVAFNKAHLNLVAGSVHLVRAPQPRVIMRKTNAVMMESAAAGITMDTESFADYHLYTLPETTDIQPRQTKQVALLTASDIPVIKTYEFLNVIPNTGLSENIKPSIFLTFKNTPENNLGIALPKGTIRLYQNNSAGASLFIGEDAINHTGKNQTIRLALGEAFDISADAKQISYRKLSEHSYRASYEMTLRNGSDTQVSVLIEQSFPKGFKIIKENIPSSVKTAQTRRWEITIPANNEQVLSYEIQVTNE